MEICELLDRISNDFNKTGSYDRYPVRFFCLPFDENTSNVLIDINKHVKNSSQLKCCEIIDFKNWLRHEDAWITKEYVLNKIRSLENSKNYIVVGLSEYARFLSNAEFITVVEALLELENNSYCMKRRIYFPCLALYSQILKTVNKISRRSEIFNPFLNEEVVGDLPIIYFVKEDLISSDFVNVINNSTEWFGLWRVSEIDIKKPIICLSKALMHFYRKASPDNVYNIKAITNYQELLKSIYGIEKIVEYELKSNEFYSKLIQLIHSNNGESLHGIILKELNTIEISEKTIAPLWKTSSEFQRWLLKNYIHLYYNVDTYLYRIMNDITDLKELDFNQASYCYIFKEQKKSYFQERDVILKSIYSLYENVEFGSYLRTYYNEALSKVLSGSFINENIDFSNDLIDKNNISLNPKIEIERQVLCFLTPYSQYERRLLIWLYRNNLIDEEKIRKIYPEFNLYLVKKQSSELEEKTIKISNYFDIYRKCKASSLEAKNYHEELMRWNLNEDKFFEWYLSLDLSYPENMLKKYSIDENVIVLDGVGGEYLEYIEGLLREKGYVIDVSAYTKSHLPTITSQAKQYFYEKFDWYRDFDKEVVHGEIYYHCSSLEKSLTRLKDLINEVIRKYEGKKIAIIADHGATINHKLVKKNKLYNFESSEHGGRCLKIDSNMIINETDDYIDYQDENGSRWLIALNEQSLCNSSPYAVHGGATIEEIIVPLIIAHPIENRMKNYRIYDTELNVSGLNKDIRVKIQPKPDIVILTAQDGTHENMQYDLSTDTWKGSLRKVYEQNININVDNAQIFSYVTIPTTKMKGNDGFDD